MKLEKKFFKYHISLTLELHLVLVALRSIVWLLASGHMLWCPMQNSRKRVPTSAPIEGISYLRQLKVETGREGASLS